MYIYKFGSEKAHLRNERKTVNFSPCLFKHMHNVNNFRVNYYILICTYLRTKEYFIVKTGKIGLYDQFSTVLLSPLFLLQIPNLFL